MARRLLNLRDVSADEAEGLRDALAHAGVEYYELPPTAFGISAGSIWVRHDHDFEQAAAVFDNFQQDFARRARETDAPESFGTQLMRNPGRVIGYTAAAVMVLLLMFWPVFQLWL